MSLLSKNKCGQCSRCDYYVKLLVLRTSESNKLKSRNEELETKIKHLEDGLKTLQYHLKQGNRTPGFHHTRSDVLLNKITSLIELDNVNSDDVGC